MISFSDFLLYSLFEHFSDHKHSFPYSIYNHYCSTCYPFLSIWFHCLALLLSSTMVQATEAHVTTRLQSLQSRMDAQDGKIDQISTQMQEMKTLTEKLLLNSPTKSGPHPEEGSSSGIILQSGNPPPRFGSTNPHHPTIPSSLFLRSSYRCLMALTLEVG